MKRIIVILSLCFFTAFSARSQGYAGYTGCSEQDSLALVAFYRATDGPNWISNQDGFSIAFLSDEVLTYYTTDYPYAGMGKWLEGPVKDWFGVLLRKQQISDEPDSAWRVVHLRPTLSRRSAGENNLKGYVPKEVGLLTALEWFKVNGNVGLSSTELPDELFHPTMLEIDIEGAFFSGALSDAFRNCSNIEFANLRDNFLDTMPAFNFVNKDVLDVYYNKTSGRTLFLYRNRLSWATIEKTVDYFVSLGNNYKYEARDQNNVGRKQEIVVTPGSSLTLTCHEAGIHGVATWYKKGFSTYITGTTYTDNNVTASDTGNYTVLLENDYVKSNDSWPDYGNTFTKTIHVTFVPSTPVHTKAHTSYNGNTISLAFSKPMVAPTAAQASEFTIKRNGETVTFSEISLSGRLKDTYTFNLASSLFMGDILTIEYTKGTVADVNGGMLNSFSDTIQNLVRPTPGLKSAVTRVDGGSVILEFDQYIDPETFFVSDFTITGNRDIPIEAITLVKGDIDDEISRKIEIVVNETLYQTDTLVISYLKGSLCVLYGAAVQSFTDIPIENRIEANFTSLNLKVIDGTGKLDRIVIKGNLKSLPFELYDDGTNGDETAGDHTWTKQLQLVNGTYTWEAYSREVAIKYDTNIVVNELGQTVITITPVQENIDSLISKGSVLTLGVLNQTLTGDSLFRFRTNSIVFIVDMKNYLENNPSAVIEPYLMGLEDDWTEGLTMTEVGAGSHEYTIKVSGYNIGDAVTYAYRNGDVWETYSPLLRNHVVAGNDTARSVFGVWPVSVHEPVLTNTLLLYPNPATNLLFLMLPRGSVNRFVSIHNLMGQCVTRPETDQQMIDISSFRPGMYIIEVTDTRGNIYRNQFIKIQ
ncbi:MAG: T9SS type A sorting domain-containing protein [Bacteroidales bacterium]|nr:T9SS type A sorting domain-containing protein [Bacteroidales bacterium]